MAFRCGNCGTTFESAERRCPNCLRKSSVVGEDDIRNAAPAAVAAAWPSGRSCPLCLERDVDDSVFYFEIARIGSTPGGNSHSYITVRSRCCASCRARALRLQHIGYLAAIPLFLGMFGVVFSMAIPDKGLLIAAMIASAMVMLVPIIFLTRTRRAFRRKLEHTQVFRRVVASVPDPGGLIEQEHWKVFASAGDEVKARAIDAADIASN